LEVENLGGIRPFAGRSEEDPPVVVITAAEGSGRFLLKILTATRIEGDVLNLHGQGREGDQNKLTGRNKRLTEQYDVPVPFFGFVNVSGDRPIASRLAGIAAAFSGSQADRRSKLRKVWLFEFSDSCNAGGHTH